MSNNKLDKRWAEKDPENNDKPVRPRNARKDYHQKTFKTPKEIAVGYVVISENKAKYSIVRLAVLSITAGIFVAFGAFVALSTSMLFVTPTNTVVTTTTTTPITSSSSSTTVVSTITTGTALNIAMAKKFIFGLTFPVGLLMIVIYGGDLFTGNVMVMTIGLLCRTVNIWQALLNLFIVYFGNMLGTAAVAGFLAYFTDVFLLDPMYTGLHDLVMAKVGFEWQVAFLKGIGCNVIVCLAIFCSTGADEMTGKVLIVYSMISAMVYMSYEHSIANTFLIPLGLMYDAPTNFAHYLSKNLIPVTIGNMVGGSLLGCLTFYLYLWGEVIPFSEKATHPDGRRLPLKNELADAFHWFMKRYRRSSPLVGGNDEEMTWFERKWKTVWCSCFYRDYNDDASHV